MEVMLSIAELSYLGFDGDRSICTLNTFHGLVPLILIVHWSRASKLTAQVMLQISTFCEIMLSTLSSETTVFALIRPKSEVVRYMLK
jgi:hypothetical protein